MRVAVLGAGPGGYVAALKAARLGAQVTVVEAAEVGGTCLNWGCIPTKSLIASAEALRKAREHEQYGIDIAGPISPNFARIMERKDKVVATQVKGIRSLFKSWGVALVEGRGRLLTPTTIEALKKDGSRETIETDAVIIATGSRPAQLPHLPIDGERILSSDHAVTLKEIPKSLLIIGAGVIGCEFACLFRELGAEITLLEALPRALSTEDPEIAELLEREFKKKKIALHTGVKVDRLEQGPDAVTAHLEDGRRMSAEKLLVSIGRALNTDDLGLEALGIARGPRGEIRVDEKMETSVPGVYAIGDATGLILLAHVASKQGIVAAANACGGRMTMDYTVVPSGIFTSPEIGSVGLREHQVAEKGLRVRVGRFLYRALGKAHALGELAGMVKIIADAGSDTVLGVHIIGAHAADLVHEGALAMAAGCTARELAGMIHAHPTLAELLMETAEDVHDEAIHAPPKK